MKKLRIAILIFFLAVVSFFAASHIYDRITSDKTAPVITAEENAIKVSISADDKALLASMTATDNIDGDVTDSLVVVSKSKFIRKGTLRVNYAAFDDSGNVQTYSREVTYTDYRSPQFSLSEPLRFASSSSNHDYLANIHADDCLDNDISNKIKISIGDTVAVSDTITEQTIDLMVTNSCGDTSSLRLTVSLEDFASYNIKCPALEKYLIYTKVGEMPDFRSNIIGVWSNGKTALFDSEDDTAGFDEQNVTVFNIKNDPSGGSGSVDEHALDITKPGIYYVKYSLASSSEGLLGTTTLIVIVEE